MLFLPPSRKSHLRWTLRVSCQHGEEVALWHQATELCRPTSDPSWQGGKTAPEDPGGGSREKNYFCMVAAPWTEGNPPAQPAAVGETPPDITTFSAGTAARGQTHVQLVSKPVCSQSYNIKCLCLVNRTTNTCDFVVNRAVRILSTSWECVILGWLF